jgi:histidine ammonia-lyase
MLSSSWSQGSGRAGLAPLVLEPNESLAIMNGTSVMRALACVAFARAARLARALTAMVTRAISGNPQHFAPELFELKPHPGTIQAGGLDPRGSRAFGREPPRSPTGPLLDSPRARAVHRAVRTVVPPVVADRRQHHDIAHVLDLYRSGKIPYDTALFETEAS